jgi:hypothetical protein
LRLQEQEEISYQASQGIILSLSLNRTLASNIKLFPEIYAHVKVLYSTWQLPAEAWVTERPSSCAAG